MCIKITGKLEGEASRIAHRGTSIRKQEHSNVGAIRLRLGNTAEIAAITGWDLDFRQLEAGQLDSEVSAVVTQRARFMNVSFNRKIHQLGSVPGDMWAFGSPFPESQEFPFCSARVGPNSLINFSQSSDFEAITPSYRGTTLSLPRQLLFEEAERRGSLESFEKAMNRGVSWENQQSCTLGEFVRGTANTLDPRLDARSLEFELANLVLDAVLGKEYVRRASCTGRRKMILDRCLQAINDSEMMPVTVADLCRMSLASPATLRRIFVSEFGIPPKTYISNRCLSALRDELSVAKPGAKVVDFANRWGFWHMGQLARDYKRMFGELPSQTLTQR